LLGLGLLTLANLLPQTFVGAAEARAPERRGFGFCGRRARSMWATTAW